MKKNSRIIGVLAALGIMVSFAGCTSSPGGEKLSEALLKSTNVQNLTNNSQTSFKVSLTGMDIPDETKQILAMVNNATVNATLKSDVKNNQTTAEGTINLLGMKVAEGGVYINNNKIWLKLPDNAKYIDLLPADSSNSLSEAQMLQLQQQSKDLVTKFLKDYFNNYNYEFLNLKSLGTKVVNTPEGNKNVSLVEVKIDNSEFPKLIDYTIKNAASSSALKEYLKGLMSLSATIDPEQKSSITDIQIQIDQDFEDFNNNADSNSKQIISEMSKYIQLGQDGIDITYGIDDQNNIISGDSKLDFVIKNPDDDSQKIEVEVNSDSVNYNLDKTVVTFPEISKDNTITFEDYAKTSPILSQLPILSGDITPQDSSSSKEISLTIGDNVALIGSDSVEMEAAPYIEGEYTMVPVKFIGDALGADVEWNGDLRQVAYKDGEHTVLMYIGSTGAIVDGNPVEMPAAPVIKNGRTMVPLRFVSEQLGAYVDWNDELKMINIYK